MIFRRSLATELANSVGGVFTVLFSIVLTVGLVRILGRAAGGRVDSSVVFELLIYTGLTNLPVLLALALFIAVLMVMMRSWQDSEMYVWFSSGGLSLLAWIRPVLRFTLPLVALVAALSVTVSPWSKDQIERITTEFRQRDDVNRIAPGRFIETMGGRRVFFIEEVNEGGTHVKNVFVSEHKDGREVIVEAERGEIKTNELGDRYIVLTNGRRYETGVDDKADWRVMDFGTYELLLEVKADGGYGSRRVDAMPFEELWSMNTPIADAQILWRLSWPLAAINLVLLAIPLSFVNPRAGRSLSLVIAVLVFILYLNGITMAQAWVKARTMSWQEGLLIVNGAVFALTALLFVRRVWLQRWLPLWLTELPYKLLGERR
ncbi:MAG: LPS export ABC transporter permease LptF [Duodenibacillus sp.]|nr:LPS export ABC transporter permease LptF [Duodenibacillus sp.]